MRKKRLETPYSAQLDAKPLDLCTTYELKQVVKEFLTDAESKVLYDLTAKYMACHTQKGEPELREELERLYIAFRVLSSFAHQLLKDQKKLLELTRSETAELVKQAEEKIQSYYGTGGNAGN